MARKADPAIRERILQQAEHLIHVRGFRGACLDDIADACGMTKPNLLHHYGSKEALGLAVLDWKMQDYKRCRVDPLCAGGDPVKAVGQMFAAAAKHFRGNGCKAGCFVANIALEMSDLSEAFRGRASLFFKDWTQCVAACLTRAKEAGLFKPSLEPKAAAESLVSLYEGAMMLARAHRDPSVFDRVGRSAQQLLSQHLHQHARRTTMGPKTPCGC